MIQWYNRGLYTILNAGLGAADLRALLLRDSYTFSRLHNTVSQVVADEASVSGYVRKTLAGKTVVQYDAGGYAYFDADDLEWTGLAFGQTISGAALYVNAGSDAASPLVGFYDFSAQPTFGGILRLRWNDPTAGAVLKLT